MCCYVGVLAPGRVQRTCPEGVGSGRPADGFGEGPAKLQQGTCGCQGNQQTGKGCVLFEVSVLTWYSTYVMYSQLFSV